MMRSVMDCAPTTRIARWRPRVLAFLGAALVGIVAPTGCVVAPSGGCCNRSSLDRFFSGSACGCEFCSTEASCGAPSGDLPCESCPSECPPQCPAPGETAECRPPRKRIWHHLHLPKCHLYEPEAGIFNFCIPPQCINPPSPLPPGRFFPVPTRPAFAQRDDYGYGLLMGGNTAAGAVGYGGASGSCDQYGNPAVPCR
jgi:hypothetical protein